MRRSLKKRRALAWTERDDEEIEYGKLYEYTPETALEEENKIRPHKPAEDIWPHWSEGRPTKLARWVNIPRFFRAGVHYKERPYYLVWELNWSDAYPLSLLKQKQHLLPSNHQSESSGVYRIFSPNKTIDRACGKDPTGTLYIGSAGTGARNWSILRTRIRSIVNGQHNALCNWQVHEFVREAFPWHSLAVEWAFTGKRVDYNGDTIREARRAERWFLNSYNDSFGELPPWNIK